jgi:type II secretory pathway component GspD/PulD (secretin)
LRDAPSENSNPEEDEKMIEADRPTEISRGRVEYQLSTRINRDGVLTAVIRPEFIGGPTDPSGEASEGDAEIQVQEGSTIVIGSLFDEVLVESAWKVPLLGDLPLLGFVFRNQGEELRTAEIITFLTITTIEKE